MVYVYPADSLTLGLQDSLARGLVQPRFSATGGNTVTIGQFEVRVPSPIWASRIRLAAFVDAGSLLGAGEGKPGALYPPDHSGLRRSYRDTAGARPSRCGVQPLRPANRAALSRAERRHAGAGAGRFQAGAAQPLHVPLHLRAAVLMRRHIIRLFLAILLGTVPALLGGATALLFTETGRLLTGRLVAGELGRVMRGRFEVARVSGNFWRTLEFDNVVIRDTTGDLLADIPHLEVRYKFPNLMAGRIILEDLDSRPGDHPDREAEERPAQLPGHLQTGRRERWRDLAADRAPQREAARDDSRSAVALEPAGHCEDRRLQSFGTRRRTGQAR